jgi:hypothetical protein
VEGISLTLKTWSSPLGNRDELLDRTGLDKLQDMDKDASRNKLALGLRLRLDGVMEVLFADISRSTYDITGVGVRGYGSFFPI